MEAVRPLLVADFSESDLRAAFGALSSVAAEGGIETEDIRRHYALNKDHNGGGRDKATAFERALGYNRSNYRELVKNIMANLAYYPAVFEGQNQYGKKYEVAMHLAGPNGKTAKMLTAWLLDQEGKARLISIYVGE